MVALSTARAAHGEICPALVAPGGAVRVEVVLDPAAGADATTPDPLVWEALRDALAGTPLPEGVTVDVRSDPRAQSPPGVALVRVQGGVLRVGALRLLALAVAFDPGNGGADLSVNVQDRVFTAGASRDWLQLAATVLDETKLGARPGAHEAVHAAGLSPSIGFLRGLIAYLAYRRLPPSCESEAHELKAGAITSLRQWDGPRQEELAAEASAVAKQLRAFLEFDDDGCALFDGGEDPVRLLVAAARLAPHRSENRRLAVIAQLHRASRPPNLCGAAVERDLLASVALAPEDQATLHDAGLAYDLLAQGAPPAFAQGEEINRVEAFRQMRRVPPAYRPSMRGVLELALGPVVSVESSREVAPGGRLELWLSPQVVPLTLRLAGEITASRDIPFTPHGIASWRRDAASLGLGYRLAGRGLFVDLFADGAIAAARVSGSDFFENRSTVSLDAGGGGGVRAGWGGRRLALSVELAGQLWAIPQWAEVDGLDERHRLPQGDLTVAVLLSFVGGIQVR